MSTYKQTNDRPNRQQIKETTRRKNTNKKKKRNKNNHVITDEQTEKWKTRINQYWFKMLIHF